MDTRFPLRKHFKTRFPAANVTRLNETVATDTFFSDIPALDDGIIGHGGGTMLQLYCGCRSNLLAVYPMKTDHEMGHNLEKTSYAHTVLLMLYSVITPARKLVRPLRKFYACTPSKTSNVNHTTSTKT